MKLNLIRILAMLSLVLNFGCRDNQGNSDEEVTNKQDKDKVNSTSCREGQFYDDISEKCHDYCLGQDKFDPGAGKCVRNEAPVITINNPNPTECAGNSYWDSNKKSCISGLPLMAFPLEDSAFYKLIRSNDIEVCVDVDDQSKTLVNDQDIEDSAFKISSAIKSWLKPLSELSNGVQFSEKNVRVYGGTRHQCNREKYFAVVHLSSSDTLSKICRQNAACAIPRTGELWVKIMDDYSSYLHEFGHIFGFKDHYLTGLGKPCQDGYDLKTTVMCDANAKFLLPADIEGMKRQFCRLMPDSEECQVKDLVNLTDISNGFMLSCKFEKEGLAIEVINNFTNVTINRYKSFSFSPESSFENIQMETKLNDSVWTFSSSQNKESFRKFKIDWPKGIASIEITNFGQSRIIEADISVKNNGESVSGLVADKSFCKMAEEPLFFKFKNDYPHIHLLGFK